MQNIKERIRTYLQLYNNNKPISDHEDLLQLGFMNKQFIYDLIDFINQEFGIFINPMEIDIPDIQSIQLLTKYIENKTELL